VATERSAHFSVPGYLGLGVEHILSGPDHLLFVLGLLLLVRNRWMLFRTVSAFTVAHSITLTATILGALRVPVPFVEALIALSILFLALEVLRAQRGGSSVAIRHPWAAAFAFGLFHGMGFASGLAALGLGQHDLLATLALFNVGVEIGQLCFIAVTLVVGYGLQRLHIGRWPQAAAIPSYIIGIAGAYWTFQSGTAWLGA
jgi:hydrogenase/urease accessory protein HupE